MEQKCERHPQALEQTLSNKPVQGDCHLYCQKITAKSTNMQDNWEMQKYRFKILDTEHTASFRTDSPNTKAYRFTSVPSS